MTEEQFIKKLFKLYIFLKEDHPFEMKRDTILGFYDESKEFFKELRAGADGE